MTTPKDKDTLKKDEIAKKDGRKGEPAKICEPRDLKPGMTIRIHQKIKETNPKGEEKERIQIFEGIILAIRKQKTNGATVTVRKISNGIGVEKILPLSLPTITKWEFVKQAKVRRAKLYYTKTHKKRLKEIKE